MPNFDTYMLCKNFSLIVGEVMLLSHAMLAAGLALPKVPTMGRCKSVEKVKGTPSLRCLMTEFKCSSVHISQSLSPSWLPADVIHGGIEICSQP